ncbi:MULTISPECIES: hypothetical protein [Psychrobacter]|uniref:hypothetical protein n=1 Tax=Psychrobacter TaxID=497 RepID=UPI000EC5AFA8|nr:MULTISPECIES: hypothetical protein [Psychrobacter]HCT74441.1 hypothetical protein [Psychrobacter sp.]
MTLANSLRIDTAIQPASYLRLLLYSGLTAVTVVLAWLASLLLWQYVLILIVTAAVTIYLTLSRPILLHLSQRIDQHWQLLLRTGRGDELWLAQLIAVSRYRWAISFEFNVIEPRLRSLSVTIFRDQVSPEQWRELNILARVY